MPAHHETGSQKGLLPRWLVWLSRFLMNGIRTFPSLIWALLAAAVVVANALAGVISLTFYSSGYLGEFLSEVFESAHAHMETAKAVRATGASRIQAFQYGLWPRVRPLSWSNTLWMLEYNLRSGFLAVFSGMERVEEEENDA